MEQSRIEALGVEIEKANIAIQRAMMIITKIEKEMAFKVTEKMQVIDK